MYTCKYVILQSCNVTLNLKELTVYNIPLMKTIDEKKQLSFILSSMGFIIVLNL